MFAWIDQILHIFRPTPAALDHMRLGPEDNPNNPLMVSCCKIVLLGMTSYARSHKLQFFTWDTLHGELSWWKHLEAEIVRLSEMGFTQVWIPPPNKAAVPVRSSDS